MISSNAQISKKLAKRKQGTIKASVNFFRTARYGLTLQEHRVVYYAILVGQQNGTPFEPVTITVDEFRELFKLSKSNSTYGDIRRASKNVLTKVVEVIYKDNEGTHLKQAQWLSDVTYHTKQGTVTITPNKALKPFFEGKQYSETEFYFLVKFTSQYAERLYELIKSTAHAAKPLIDFSVDDLRDKLSIPATKYANFKDLRNRVLLPAVSDINEFTDLEVTFKEKRGLRNKVEIVFFAVTQKSVPKCAIRDARGDFEQKEYKPPLSDEEQIEFLDDLLDGQISFGEVNNE